MNRRSQGISARGLMVGALVTSLGCALTQRPALKVVDPTLVEQGTELTRERRKGGFALGPYEIHDVGVRTEAPDPDGPLAREDVPRPVTQHRAGLIFDAPTERSWTTSCTMQRRASNAGDYRAVLDENGDEISLDCVAKSRGLPPWNFSTRAALSGNFVGALKQTGGDEEFSIEVLTRVTHFQRVERLLPVPVVQLREGETAKVAMVMGRPERAWITEGFDPVTMEASLAVMLTLRYMPWELAE
ncbi:MAG: hypothetical protein AAF799_22380 [Myxococcota bacterium]